MSKLEAINVDKLGEEIVGILSGANSLLNTDESEQTVTDLQASFRALKNILRSVDEIGVEKTIESANSVLQNLDGTLETLDGVLNPNSPLQYNLIQVTGELEETARSIRALVETLERQPQSLIFGKPNAVEENRNEQ
jgi:paraquat-inducible protein B